METKLLVVSILRFGLEQHSNNNAVGMTGDFSHIICLLLYHCMLIGNWYNQNRHEKYSALAENHTFVCDNTKVWPGRYCKLVATILLVVSILLFGLAGL